MKKIHFLADQRPPAQKALQKLLEHQGQTPLDDADVIVVLGGDGFMLRSLHEHYLLQKPFYGLNFGRIGFLLNTYHPDHLIERLTLAHTTTLYPLKMQAKTLTGECFEAMALNEVALLRQTHQTAKIQVMIDDIQRIPELVADGVLLSTPAGSTAYNASIQGPILPLGSALLALSPISPFRPRRWRGALLKNTSTVRFNILFPETRQVSATADDTEIRNVTEVIIKEDRTHPLFLLFDPHHQLEERIFLEQFQ